MKAAIMEKGTDLFSMKEKGTDLFFQGKGGKGKGVRFIFLSWLGRDK